MTIKRHNTIVIACSAVIAIIISLIQWQKNKQHIESRVYRVNNGWGYDILVDQRLLIHQESIPALKAGQRFVTKEQAGQAAQLVIKKLRSGQSPALTKPDLEPIIGVHESGKEQYGKHQ